MTEMLQHLVNGLSITGIYVLGAVGFNLLFGVLKIANFAHGAFVALGAYTVLLLVVDAGTSYMVAIVTAIVVAGMGGVILERGLLRFTGSMELVLVGTLGVASFMEEGLLLWVGGDTRTIPTQVNGSIDFADLHVQNQSVATILVSVVTIAVLSLVLYRTLPGRMVRAVAEEPEGAESIGINVGLIRAVVAAVAVALAALAGALLAPAAALQPFMGQPLLITAFLIGILGGLGSFPGAVVAAVVLGVSESLVSGYLGAMWSELFSFGLVITLLVVRPTGLFRTTQSESAHA